MTQHTPGPWSIAEGEPDWAIVTENVLVASVHGEDTENQEANARLIAAAPELLGALRTAVFHLMGKARRDPDEREVIEQMRDAIAKAERS